MRAFILKAIMRKFEPARRAHILAMQVDRNVEALLELRATAHVIEVAVRTEDRPRLEAGAGERRVDGGAVEPWVDEDAQPPGSEVAQT